MSELWLYLAKARSDCSYALSLGERLTRVQRLRIRVARRLLWGITS